MEQPHKCSRVKEGNGIPPHPPLWIITSATAIYIVKLQSLELGWVEYHGWLELI
jgi:hypothetical protein